MARKLVAILTASATCTSISPASIIVSIELSIFNISLAKGKIEESVDKNILGKYVSFQVQTKENKNTTKIAGLDRKSTRLNSSHVAISYAVFCLKKKKKEGTNNKKKTKKK